MNKILDEIANRLSLRTPQRESLRILARLAELLPLTKQRDLAAELQAVAGEFPSVKDFERDFPSLCFALATGVGKTRLMGAFISYLKMAKGMRHFFVLAPNLTIYNKLIADFTDPNAPKYVFNGIGEFAGNPPVIITGDNYEAEHRYKSGFSQQSEEVHINIFNISKINSKDRNIKNLSEYIGSSYFDYLAELDDLVVLMDESHRYRASAGVETINALKPVLGLELTATPQVEKGGKSIAFKNVVYNYPLAHALKDGYVKKPAVTTRAGFVAENYTDKNELERLKLEDGVTLHKQAKVALEVYAANRDDKKRVKPFMLVVAENKAHAESIAAFIQSDEFHNGYYKDRVTTIHYGLRGEEQDKAIGQLLAVEDPDEPTEIVIHVNMLKEGWDVTNLYTIVPLRAANSRTLVEQSIGRGLRLPYGERTGEDAIDLLSIVAHEHFDQIIEDANKPDSIIRAGITIGEGTSSEAGTPFVIKSKILSAIEGDSGAPNSEEFLEPAVVGDDATMLKEPTPPLYGAEQEVAKIAYEFVAESECLSSSAAMLQEENLQRLTEKVEAAWQSTHEDADDANEKPNTAEAVKKIIGSYIKQTIDIPHIVPIPQDAPSYTFTSFTLDTSKLDTFAPVDERILRQHLDTVKSDTVQSTSSVIKKERLEGYIVDALANFSDVAYDKDADVLYDLSAQMVAHLRSSLNNEDELLNVLQYHRSAIATAIHKQMQDHCSQDELRYEYRIIRGFKRPREITVSLEDGQKARHFRNTLDEPRLIKSMLFHGFNKCIYDYHKFDSNSEREFAVLLERDKDVVKWCKPAVSDLKIAYAGGHDYLPDFVVETTTQKFLCEPKQAEAIKAPDTLAKTKAAVKWCEEATKHAEQNGGKKWSYILIPHDEIKPSATLAGLVGKFKKENK